LKPKFVHFLEVLGIENGVFEALKVSVEQYSMKGERAK